MSIKVNNFTVMRGNLLEPFFYIRDYTFFSNLSDVTFIQLSQMKLVFYIEDLF